MLAILSPAKNMHRVPTPPHATRPMFLPQTETLAASMKRYAPFQLESVLKVNPQLALRAFTDIQDVYKRQLLESSLSICFTLSGNRPHRAPCADVPGSLRSNCLLYTSLHRWLSR